MFKKGISLHCFNLLKEVCFMNNKAFYIKYEDHNSFDVLYTGSVNLPRKKKKRLRKMIKEYRH